VRQIAYFGNESRIVCETPKGDTVTVSVSNTAAARSAALAVGDQRWLSWHPEDTLVFDS
jgi:ABC-type Fe3+/spermidine/putrescine transport system ATPase subunit